MIYFTIFIFRITSNNQDRNSFKRKNLQVGESDSIESNYKVKSHFQNDSNDKKMKNFALPIKTSTGLIVKNARQIDSDTEDSGSKNKKVKKYEETLQPAITPAKTFIEILREKRESIEKNKEKIASYSREVLQNPQEEVILK